MGDRTTVISCPAHDLCVFTFMSCPVEELGERVALSLPFEYERWTTARREAVFQVEHTPATKGPDALLIGDVVIAPKDIAPRMAAAEARIDELDLGHRALRAVQVDTRDAHDSAQAEIEHELDSLGNRVRSDEEDALRYHFVTSDRLSKLEEFATRTRSGRRWWFRERKDDPTNQA
jgi:hypothetical protein